MRVALEKLAKVQFAFYDREVEVVWVPNMAHHQVGATLAECDKGQVVGKVAGRWPLERDARTVEGEVKRPIYQAAPEGASLLEWICRQPAGMDPDRPEPTPPKLMLKKLRKSTAALYITIQCSVTHTLSGGSTAAPFVRQAEF